MMKKLVSAGNKVPTGDGLGRGMRWSDRISNFVGRSLKAALPGVVIALASQLQILASDLRFKLEQDGADVLMTLSGSVDTSSLVSVNNGWSKSNGSGNASAVYVSINTLGFVTGSSDTYNGQWQSTPTGRVDVPAFGSFVRNNSNQSALLVNPRSTSPALYFVSGYNGGTLSDQVTLANKQLTGSTRSYVWTLPNQDTVTIEIIPDLSLSSTAAVNGSSASGSTVDFTATFSGDATGVDKTDFALATTGTAAGTISSVTPVSASTYTVSVTGVVGTGTLRLDLNPSGTGIQDTRSTPQNITGGFTSGTPFSVDHNPVLAATPTSASITTVAAVLGGNVTSDNSAAITERGVVVSKTDDNANPAINGTGVTKITGTGTTGVFTVNATGLTLNTGYSFKAYAINAAGTSYSSVATFNTLNNTAPVATDLTGSVNEDSSVTLNLTATDVDNNVLTYTVVTGPANGTLGSIAQPGTPAQGGLVVYTPPANFNGTVTFTFKANDGLVDSATKTMTVTVNPVNDAPTLTTPTTIALTDTSSDDSFSARTGTLSGSDIDSNTLSYGINTGTANSGVITKTGTYGTLTVTTASGAYSFAANATAINALTANASETFAVTVSDGALSATADLVVNITAANDTPALATPTAIAITDTAAADTFSASTGTLSATDRDTGPTFTYGITGGTVSGTTSTKKGTYGTLEVETSSGAYTFKPDNTAINALGANNGESFTVTDAAGASMTYEFDADGKFTPGRVAIPFAFDDTATDIGVAAADAVSQNPPL